LANTQTSNETTGIDGTQVAVCAHENGNTDHPNETELTGCPETTDTVTHKEGNECTTH